MMNGFAKVTWKRIRKQWKNRSDNHITKAGIKREQSIAILQKRYGYTKEKAISELDEHYRNAILF